MFFWIYEDKYWIDNDLIVLTLVLIMLKWFCMSISKIISLWKINHDIFKMCENDMFEIILMKMIFEGIKLI